jgi:hypothetical protein
MALIIMDALRQGGARGRRQNSSQGGARRVLLKWPNILIINAGQRSNVVVI